MGKGRTGSQAVTDEAIEPVGPNRAGLRTARKNWPLRVGVTLAALAGLGFAAHEGLYWYARRQIVSRARAAGVELEFSGLKIGWKQVELTGVSARFPGVRGLEVRVERIAAGWRPPSAKVLDVEATTVTVAVKSDIATLAADLERFRADREAKVAEGSPTERTIRLRDVRAEVDLGVTGGKGEAVEIVYSRGDLTIVGGKGALRDSMGSAYLEGVEARFHGRKLAAFHSKTLIAERARESSAPRPTDAGPGDPPSPKGSPANSGLGEPLSRPGLAVAPAKSGLRVPPTKPAPRPAKLGAPSPAADPLPADPEPGGAERGSKTGLGDSLELPILASEAGLFHKVEKLAAYVERFSSFTEENIDVGSDSVTIRDGSSLYGPWSLRVFAQPHDTSCLGSASFAQRPAKPTCGDRCGRC